MTLRCPSCKGEETMVKDSRPTALYGFPSVRRRRQCSDEACGHRFTTFEIEAGIMHERVGRTPEFLREKVTRLVDEGKRLLEDLS